MRTNRTTRRPAIEPAALADRVESATRAQLVAALASLERRERVALDAALKAQGASVLNGHREDRRPARAEAPATCPGRDPLLHGSRACPNSKGKDSDLCDPHAAALWPLQLIRGSLYFDDGCDEEGSPVANPWPAGVERRAQAAEMEVARLQSLLNTPEVLNFAKAVQLEAAHQRERWGSDHDSGKSDADWFWLIGYLAGKALHNPGEVGDGEKRLHRIVTVAAAAANWHAAILGKTNMRPGILPPAGEETPRG